MMKKKIFIIDDDDFYIEEITHIARDLYDVKAFHDPNEVEENITEKDFSSLALVIVDFDFRTKTAADNDIAGYLRDLGYRGPIILCSLIEDYGPDMKYIEENYDAIISKHNLSLRALEQVIESYFQKNVNI